MSTAPTAAAVIVRNPLPAEFTAIGAGALEQSRALAVRAAAMTPSTVEDLVAANVLFKEVDGLAKTIAADRMALTRPIDVLKEAIIAAEREACEPLRLAKDALGRRMVACEHKLREERRQAEEKARQEAEERARAERRRLEAERAERQRLAEEERAKAQTVADAEAAVFGEEAAALPPVPAAEPIVFVPTVERPAALAAPLPKSAAKATARRRLVITDATKIPLEIAGKRLLVPDEKAIEALLKAGIDVPGAMLMVVDGISA